MAEMHLVSQLHGIDCCQWWMLICGIFFSLHWLHVLPDPGRLVDHGHFQRDQVGGHHSNLMVYFKLYHFSECFYSYT